MPNIANIVTIVALIVASFLISYLTAQHALKQARDSAREQLELRLEALTTAIAELEASVAELTRPPIAEGAEPNAVAQAEAQSNHEVTPEVLILISAAVTSFLGKKVRIRSAKMLQSPYEIVNPWAQQGRVIVQASHNLQVRHR